MRVFVVKKIHIAAAVLVLFLSLVFWGAQDNIRSVLSGNLKPIYSVKTDNNRIGLTFDISWGQENVLPVLEILESEKIKATFFLSSPWAQSHPEVVKQIADSGHEIGSHGKRHVDLNTLSEQVLTEELNSSREVLENLTGRKITLLRPPNGAYDNKVISVANSLNYRVIQWSVDSLDWKRPGPDKVFEYVINGRSKNKGASPGDIILFHASDSAPDTPKALPAIIRTLKSKGYELTPVGVLLQDALETWPPESNL